MPFETYKLGIKRLDTTPVGAGGVVLNDNFTELADLAEAAQSHIYIDVMDYGAVGDGTTDDSGAFQAAIDVLEPTGGTLYVPSKYSYIVGNVTIESKYPIWIKSDMCNHILAGAATATWAAKGTIRPPLAGCTHIFKWTVASGVLATAGAGGGIQGVCFSDIYTTGPAGGAYHDRTISTGALWVDDALAWTCRDCEFQWLKGSAINVDNSIYCKIKESKFYYCGDLANTKPVLDIGGAAGYAFVWSDRLFMEGAFYTTILIRANGAIDHSRGYHENAANATYDATYVDADLGVAHLSNTYFGGTTGTAVILGTGVASGAGPSIQNCRFNNGPGANRMIWIKAGAYFARLSNLQLTAPAQTGALIDCASNDCTFSNIYCVNGGQILITGTNCHLSNFYCYAPSTPAGQYHFDLSAGTTAIGCVVDGKGVSVCHGFRTDDARLIGCEVKALATNTNGLYSTGVGDIYVGNTLSGISGTGVPITYSPGMIASGNQGYTATVTDLAGDDDVTLNAETGIITTKALTTAEGAVYQITLNNNYMHANSRFNWEVDRGTCTQGYATKIQTILLPAGGATLSFMNWPLGTGAYNGTMRILFEVVH
jgi:hypothetical protein